MSVFDSMQVLGLNWHPHEIRCHLNRFLFRKNEEINTLITNLSGGEKARLCLALAAKTPKLLILDEITNNLDLDLIQVLKKFPAAIIAISHDEDFLQAIQINQIYQIEDECILAVS